MKNIIIAILILTSFVLPCMAVPVCDINIYYPNNNTTTRIHYAESGDYNITYANNITGAFTAVIIKNEKEYVNIIESPHKIISPVFGLITLIILISFIIVAAKLVKRVWS